MTEGQRSEFPVNNWVLSDIPGCKSRHSGSGNSTYKMNMSSSEATDELWEQVVSSLFKLPPLLQPTPPASQGIPEAIG